MSFSVPVALGQFSPGVNGGTSGSIDTTGYDILLLIIANYTSGALTISDNKSDATWTSTRSSTTSDLDTANLYWAWDSTKRGTGHTFSVTGTSVYPGVIIAGCIGGKTSANPKDQSTTAIVQQGGGTTIGPTITPGSTNQLIISTLAAGAAPNSDMVLSTADGFTKLTGYDFIGGTNIAGAVAYRIDTAIASATPVWSCGTSTIGLASCIASFLPVPASTNAFKGLPILGAGA